MALCLEVVIRQAQGEAAPDVRLATQAPRTHPRVVGAGIGMVLLVDNDVLAVVGAAPPLHVGVDLGVGRVLRSVRRLTYRVLVHRERVMARWHLAAAGVIVRP